MVSSILKTPKQVFFNPINIFDILLLLHTLYYCFFNLLFSFNVKIGENGRKPRQHVHRRIGSPSKSHKEKKKMLEETWVMELKRRGNNSRASRQISSSRTTTRPALTAAGKAFLHDIAIDRVKNRYKHGIKSSVKTTRMRMLSKMGV